MLAWSREPVKVDVEARQPAQARPALQIVKARDFERGWMTGRTTPTERQYGWRSSGAELTDQDQGG
jgi:hypothetical protein